MKKKGEGKALDVVISAIIALIIMVVLISIIGYHMKNTGMRIEDVKNFCPEGVCKEKCDDKETKLPTNCEIKNSEDGKKAGVCCVS